MNLLLLSDVYFPRVNGVSTSIRTFAKTLARMGHSVTIVAPEYPAAGTVAEGDGDFEVIRLASRRVFFDPEDRLIRGAALREGLRLLAQRHWDVIHIHTPFRAHQLGVRLARLTGRPTVETYHTHFEEYAELYLPWLPKSLLRWTARRLSRRLCHEVDHLIVPTEQMVAVLDGYGIDTQRTVIPTGIDLAEFTGGSGPRFRREHGLAAERPTLVTVSRLAREKNIPFLLEVAHRLLPEFPNLAFIIAGEGPDAERLSKLVARRGLGQTVRFVGNLPRADALLDCYRAGDVFVFASPTETQGLVLVEAMALGLPIVSTAVLGTAAVLAHARGARISREDPAAFAAHVAALLRSPQQRVMLSRASWLDARAWDADRWMGRVVRLYSRLASLVDAAHATSPSVCVRLGP
jgi:glycosyltransferase involved in cell wall biosynthesis